MVSWLGGGGGGRELFVEFPESGLRFVGGWLSGEVGSDDFCEVVDEFALTFNHGAVGLLFLVLVGVLGEKIGKHGMHGMHGRNGDFGAVEFEFANRGYALLAEIEEP